MGSLSRNHDEMGGGRGARYLSRDFFFSRSDGSFWINDVFGFPSSIWASVNQYIEIVKYGIKGNCIDQLVEVARVCRKNADGSISERRIFLRRRDEILALFR